MKISDKLAFRLLLATVAVAVGTLVVQDQRGGWPFSRHRAAPVAAAPVAAAPRAEAGAAATRTAIELDSRQFDRLGIRFEAARLEPVESRTRAVATVAADERRLAHVHTRVAGWVERLYVASTGEAVKAGQPVAALFSQELLASQNEFLTARRLQREIPTSLVLESARARLGVLGMGPGEIAALERDGKARRLVTIFAPRSGIVLRRGVTVGTAVDPSTELVTIADLSRVWVFAEVPESDASQVHVGTPATLEFPGSGRPPFPATVEFVYPTLTERTRALRVRFSVANSDGVLRPGLYGTARFGTGSRESLTIPRDAVVDTGETQHVFVRTATGTIEPRTVRLGVHLAERTEVVSGLETGEEVVASGVFLIDSESRLRASGGGGTSHSGHSGDAKPEPRERARPEQAASPAPPSGHSNHGP